MAAQPATFAEAMQRVLQDLVNATLTPDADVQFLTKLQGIIVGRLKAGPGQQQGQQPSQGQPNQLGQPGQPAPMQQMPPQQGSQLQGQPGPNGVMPLAPPPNPDELRRMIASGVGAQGS